MKYFLSQPMTGYSEQEIRDVRKALTEVISNIHPEWVLIDSLIFEDAPEHIQGDNIGIYFLGKSIMLLAEADVMVIPDKAHYVSRGCSTEFMIANLYKIPIYILDTSTNELKLYNIEDDFVEMEEVIKEKK